jgi:superfamily II DNA or RNA helicase
MDFFDCAQLRRIRELLSNSLMGRHGLIVCISPLIAKLVAHWVAKKCLSGTSETVEFISARMSTDLRPRVIAQLRDGIEDGSITRCIIVSTYTIIGTGIDGLQLFMDYLIRFGEPFETSFIQQARSRIIRPGSCVRWINPPEEDKHPDQKHVDVWTIHGSKSSIEYDFVTKHRTNSAGLNAMTNLYRLIEPEADILQQHSLTTRATQPQHDDHGCYSISSDTSNEDDDMETDSG